MDVDLAPAERVGQRRSALHRVVRRRPGDPVEPRGSHGLRVVDFQAVGLERAGRCRGALGLPDDHAPTSFHLHGRFERREVDGESGRQRQDGQRAFHVTDGRYAQGDVDGHVLAVGKRRLALHRAVGVVHRQTHAGLHNGPMQWAQIVAPQVDVLDHPAKRRVVDQVHDPDILPDVGRARPRRAGGHVDGPVGEFHRHPVRSGLLRQLRAVERRVGGCGCGDDERDGGQGQQAPNGWSHGLPACRRPEVEDRVHLDR